MFTTIQTKTHNKSLLIDSKECPWLVFAARNNEVSLVKAMIQANQTPEALAAFKRLCPKAILSATYWGHVDMIKTLLTLDPTFAFTYESTRKKTLLHAAAEKGHLGCMEILLDAQAAFNMSAQINFQDSQGNTPLDIALNCGKTQLAVISP